MNVDDLTPAGLVDALRNAAEGIPNVEAAVELLIGHNGNSHWLHRLPFLTHVVIVGGNHEEPDLFADVDWEALDRLAHHPDTQPAGVGPIFDTESELGVLRVACSIARGWLGDALTSCDQHNVGLIVEAIKRAGGAR